ncbi:hypothetical protein H310_07131 [Aphanomyces invadans]|uniref:Uncharacterized protein n=1 Tax=Aphanomyces invadans TaxID=157072 RepID=A0A024U4K8_9STRA|nr:hypothetical protein H310_07131 [Aphanomyces invadans]ETW00543.1 hypothetical protein H310_07131 [Aphanomyces invadans]|eukprot:XP_008870678.1 hypothetical protein H310_07131 [Aphanomyces invadans]
MPHRPDPTSPLSYPRLTKHASVRGDPPTSSERSPAVTFAAQSHSIKHIWWSAKHKTEHLFTSFYAHNPQALARATPVARDVEAAELGTLYRHRQLEMLRGPATSFATTSIHDESFALVPTSRLAKLERLEQYLKAEQARLEAQCVWAFQDTPVSARLPVQFIVVAVHSILDKAIADSAMTWAVHRNARCVLPDGLATAIAHTTQHLSHCDHVHRINKSLRLPNRPHHRLHALLTTQSNLHQLHRQATEYHERFDMAREEKLQRMHHQWSIVNDRKADYTKYVDLALQFQPLSEADFNATAWPGHFYELRLRGSCHRIERFIHRHGPRRRAKKFSAARTIQSLVRGFKARRRYRPAMMFRRRTWHNFMRHTFVAWRGWTTKAAKAKRILRTALASRQATCFGRWVEFVRVVRAEKERKVRGALAQLLYNRTESVLRSWRGYASRMKSVRRMNRRTVATNRGYYFYTWRAAATAVVLGRLQQRCAVKVQAVWRRLLATRETQHRRTSYNKAAVHIQAVARGRCRRRQPVPPNRKEEIRRAAFLGFAQSLAYNVAVACEVRRRKAENDVVKLTETSAINALKEAQASKEGEMQLARLAAAERARHVTGTHAVFLRTYDMTKAEAMAVVAQRQVDKALADAEQLARQMFRLQRPPPFECIHPSHLDASFATADEFLSHSCCPMTPEQRLTYVMVCDGKVAGGDSVKLVLRLWSTAHCVLAMTDSDAPGEQVATDVALLPLPPSSRRDDVGSTEALTRALIGMKKWFAVATLSSISTTSSKLERIRLAAELRWQVLLWISSNASLERGLLDSVPYPPPLDRNSWHSLHYDHANKSFFMRWASLQHKKLLPHFQRDAAAMLLGVGVAAQDVVVKRLRAMHGLRQRASRGYIHLVEKRAVLHVVKRFHARNGLWSLATQAVEALRAWRKALTELHARCQHAAARVDVAAWLCVYPSMSLMVSGIHQCAVWNLRRQVAAAFLLDVAARAHNLTVPDTDKSDNSN